MELSAKLRGDYDDEEDENVEEVEGIVELEEETEEDSSDTCHTIIENTKPEVNLIEDEPIDLDAKESSTPQPLDDSQQATRDTPHSISPTASPASQSPSHTTSSLSGSSTRSRSTSPHPNVQRQVALDQD